jgi:DNA-directed RNA polymerase specialized sigma24 family protein
MEHPFNDVVECLRRRVLSRIQRDADYSGDVEDAVDEALLRYLTGDPTAEDEDHLVAWLIVVARHYLVDTACHAKTLPRVSLQPDDTGSTLPAEDMVDSVALRLMVRQAWKVHGT